LIRLLKNLRRSAFSFDGEPYATRSPATGETTRHEAVQKKEPGER
jgi:hypothetical protein